MIVAGIDYSMSCPAITIGKNKDYKDCKTFFYTKSAKVCGKYNNQIYGIPSIEYGSEMERFDQISDWAITVLRKFKVYEVCLEGYAMGAKGRVFNIAENTGILKYKLWKADMNVITPSPNTIKKYFSGSGNASKEVMYDSFLATTSLDLESLMGLDKAKNPISDIVDSYAMMCYGHDNIN